MILTISCDLTGFDIWTKYFVTFLINNTIMWFNLNWNMFKSDLIKEININIDQYWLITTFELQLQCNAETHWKKNLSSFRRDQQTPRGFFPKLSKNLKLICLSCLCSNLTPIFVPKNTLTLLKLLRFFFQWVSALKSKLESSDQSILIYVNSFNQIRLEHVLI